MSADFDASLQAVLPLLSRINGAEPDACDLADVLWLATYLDAPPATLNKAETPDTQQPPEPTGPESKKPIEQPADQTPKPATPNDQPQPEQPKIYPKVGGAGQRPALGFRAPALPALPNALELSRALKPLRRKLPSRTRKELDEDATAAAIAAQRLAQHGYWEPVWSPAREPWFELHLVVDSGATMMVWREVIAEFIRLLERSGAFRRVQTYGLATDGAAPVLRLGLDAQARKSHSPTQLVLGIARPLVLVLSDCVGPAWHTACQNRPSDLLDGAVNQWLRRWAKSAPVAVLQMLPRRLWDGSALGRGEFLRLFSRVEAPTAAELQKLGGASRRKRPKDKTAQADLLFPVLTLEPSALDTWGRLLAGHKEAWCAGVAFGPDAEFDPKRPPDAAPTQPDEAEIRRRFDAFLVEASPLARQLAGLLAAAPLTPPVMRLVQGRLLRQSGPLHLAELFLSGLIHRRPKLEGANGEPFYDFRPEVRGWLTGLVGKPKLKQAMCQVSAFVAERTGGALDFAALVAAPSTEALREGGLTLDDENTRHFAEIAATVFRQFGGRYAKLADALKGVAGGSDSLLLHLADEPKLNEDPNVKPPMVLKKPIARAKFSWLHLSDLHFGLTGRNTLWPNLRESFFYDLEKLHEATGPWQVVVFTGDLVQTGKSAEFQEVQNEVFERLWDKLKQLGSGDAVLLAVPGNHDLLRPNPSENNPTLDTLPEKIWLNPTGPYINVIRKAFGAYAEWWKNCPQCPTSQFRHGIIPGDFAFSLKQGDYSIGIVGLNTAFLQLQGGDYQGKLAWDVRQLALVCGGDIEDWIQHHDLCLLLTHHSPDWLTPETQWGGETEIAPAGRFALHLFGHRHDTAINYLSRGGNPDATRLIQGYSIFGMETFGEPPTIQRSHGYAVGQLEFDGTAAHFRLWPRIATNKIGNWRFIPDYENVHLQADQGTAEETIPLRKHKPPGSKPSFSPIIQAAPHSTLPSRRPFFGRAQELAVMAQCLSPKYRSWGVLLEGPGGIGKTALALEAAHRAPGEDYPLKLFVTAKSHYLEPDGSYERLDGRVDGYFAMLNDIGLGLGCDDIQLVPRDQLAELVRYALAGRHVLLVLDNLESFSRDERRRLYNWLEILPVNCQAIVTSRRRDDTSARSLRLDKLDYEATRELLAEFGTHWPPVAQLSEADCQTLYSETGGNPMLLTWTAGQLGRTQGRCRTVAEALARLREAHLREKQAPNNDPLEFIFGDLLDTFTTSETAVLAALSYFTEPARLSWLLPLTDLSETAALTALDDLHNRALLAEYEGAETWFLQPLAARFLQQRMPEAVGKAGKRLVEAADSLAMRHGGFTDKAPFMELKAVWPVIQAALPMFLSGDNSLLQRIYSQIHSFLEYSGKWDLLLSLNKKSENQAIGDGDIKRAGWRSYQAGWLYFYRGEISAVNECAEHCRKYFSQTGDWEKTLATQLFGHSYYLQKDFASAINLYHEVVKIRRTLAPDSEELAIGINSLAEAELQVGDWDNAENNFREALRIAHIKNHKSGIANYLGNLADLYILRQNWIAAEEQASEAMDLSIKLDRLDIIAKNHCRLAQALLHQSRAEEALLHAQQAVDIFTLLRHRNLPDAQCISAKCKAACTESTRNES